MSEIKRLSGKDGKLYLASLGNVITGDGETILEAGKWYVPITIASTTASGSYSGFPEGVTAGVAFVGDGLSAPSEDETYIALTNTPQCDVTSCNVEFSMDELDQSTLCDEMKKYTAGLPDAQGTIEGIMTLGKSEVFAAKVITVQKQDAAGEITTTEQNYDTVYMALCLNKSDSTDADVAYLFAPVKLFGFEFGVSVGENQTFSTSFRITQDNYLKAALVEADKALFE